MKRLSDYSGQFLPNLKPRDFCHNKLAELLKLYSRLFIVLDGLWYRAVREKMGNKKALACDERVWKRMCKYEMATIKRRLRIRGKDVIALMKAVQVCPLGLICKYKMKIKNKNSAMFTVTYCPALDALEQEGKGREAEICGTIGPKIQKGRASVFNPDIQVKCLKLPPRKSKDDICCQWEFSLEEYDYARLAVLSAGRY